MLEHIWDRRNPSGEAADAGPAGDRTDAATRTGRPNSPGAGRHAEGDAAPARPPARAPEPRGAVSPRPQAPIRRPGGEAADEDAKDGPDGKEGQRLVVGARIHLKGEVSNCDALIVQGHLEGSAKSRILQVAQGGTFVGEAEVEIAEVSGSIQGTLTASGNLIIRSTGRVHGTIRYYAVQIEPGGQLGGDVQVTADSDAARPAPAAGATDVPGPAARTGP